MVAGTLESPSAGNHLFVKVQEFLHNCSGFFEGLFVVTILTIIHIIVLERREDALCCYACCGV